MANICSVLLLLLLVIMVIMQDHGGGAADPIASANGGNNVLRLSSMDVDHAHHRHHQSSSSSSNMDHLDPAVLVFFTLEDLKLGKTMPIYFPRKDPSSSPPLLPREKADPIPFSLKELPYLLDFFSISQDSPQAEAMKNALRECEIKTLKGETKFCATSLESMFDFARSILGLDSHFQMVTTKHYRLEKSSTLLQNYTVIEEPEEIPAPKMVACHTMPYPYTIFYCHSQETESKVFKVSLGGENGEKVDALAVCHMDTSQWNPHHVSFLLLGIAPGTSPICHFFPEDHLVLVPATNLN